MPRITPIDPQDTDVRTAATLKGAKSKLGMLPNLLTTLARAPATLHGYLALAEALAGGRLTARQRELIAIAIAQENACEYCLSAHSALAKSAGLDEEDIERARWGSAAHPIDEAVVSFALQVARDRGDVGDERLEEARRNGVDDGLILEIIAHVALNVLTNYVNRVAGTEVDFPRVRLLSAA